MSSKKVLPRIAEWKVKEVGSLLDMINKHNIIGIAKMDGLSAAQLQILRKHLKKNTILRMSRNTLMTLALEKANNKKKNIISLKDYISGASAFLFTNENPFKISLFLQKNKSKTWVKGGEVASDDISIPAGDTGLPPGPIVSELQSMGIPTKIQRGTIYVEKDTIVVKKGEVISNSLAALLKRLNIQPKEVGLILTAAYDNGIIIPGDLLNRPLEEYTSELFSAISSAYNLAFNATILTDETTEPLLQKAHMDALALAIAAGILTPETASMVISKGYMQAIALAQVIKNINPDAIPELPKIEKVAVKAKEKETAKEVVKEEPKEEEEIGGLSDLFG